MRTSTLQEKRRLYGDKLKRKDAILKLILSGDTSLKAEFQSLVKELAALEKYLDSFN